MSFDIQWQKDCIAVEPPKRPKRITGTRFASVLGLNPWSTPFEAWCAITKTYEEPFEDNKFTLAGKAIEPKVINYLNLIYFNGSLVTPEDMYGKDFFKKTYGNFFPEVKVFGGMWDALLMDSGNVLGVIEVKTTKRVEDWSNGAPDFYGLQAALYAHLLGIDQVVMVASFLKESDYENPENFVPSADNTIVDDFLVSERYPHFAKHVEYCLNWWHDHVETGVSPAFDEHKDAAILAELRKNKVDTSDSGDIQKLLHEAEVLKQHIDVRKESFKAEEKRLKDIATFLKEFCMDRLTENDDKVVLEGVTHDWVLSKSTTYDIDKAQLEADGLLEKYLKPSVTYRFGAKERK